MDRPSSTASLIAVPLTVFALSLAVVTFSWYQTKGAVEAEKTERFRSEVQRIHDSIQERLETYLVLLHAGAALFASSDTVTPEQFRDFVRELDLVNRYRGIQGIGYSARVPEERLETVVQARRRTGQPAFRVWPEDLRDEYHTILYLEPLDERNQAALGFDMFTDDTRREAMERARDSGEAATTGLVTLKQEIDEDDVQPGFLIYLPVYEGGVTPATPEERRARLTGFVYSPFRARDLFADIMSGATGPRAAFALYDDRRPAPERLLYDDRLSALPGRDGELRTVTVPGREWTLVVSPTAQLESASGDRVLPFMLWAGVVVSAVLALVTALQTRARQRAERSEARERAARTEAERANRMKDEFLATLSHELRTPLNAVVGWAHMLNSGALPEDKRNVAAGAILRNARMQSRLIEDLLDMSSIISGRVRVDTALLDVRDVVTAALDVVRPTADAKHVRLSLEADDGAHPVIGDPNRLQQVVWNLLTNAVKFTPPAGRVTLTLRRRESRVEIVVSDTGVGVEPRFLPFVFDRFRQEDASFTRDYGGLGLGLSIVRSLVEMHAGTVAVESRGRNQGATFTVSLPLASEDARAHMRPDARRRPVPADTEVLRRVLVLIVDDDPDALSLAEEILRQQGARTLTAESGAEALHILETCREQVGLLVSDIGMPQMDGLELIRRVRAMPSACGGTAPAIALTAYAASEDRRRAIAAGFNLHLAKPFTPDELIATSTLLLTYRFKERRRTGVTSDGALLT